MYTMVLTALFSFCRCLQPQQQRRRGPALARAAAAAVAVMMTTWWSRWPRLQQFCIWLRTSRKLNTHERCATRERERQKEDGRKFLRVGVSAVHTEVMNLSGVIYMDTADREYDQLTLVRVSWSYLGLTLVYNTGSFS